MARFLQAKHLKRLLENLDAKSESAHQLLSQVEQRGCEKHSSKSPELPPKEKGLLPKEA